MAKKDKSKQDEIKESVKQMAVSETIPAQKNGELTDAEKAYIVHKINTR